MEHFIIFRLDRDTESKEVQETVILALKEKENPQAVEGKQVKFRAYIAGISCPLKMYVN